MHGGSLRDLPLPAGIPSCVPILSLFARLFRDLRLCVRVVVVVIAELSSSRRCFRRDSIFTAAAVGFLFCFVSCSSICSSLNQSQTHTQLACHVASEPSGPLASRFDVIILLSSGATGMISGMVVAAGHDPDVSSTARSAR